MVASGLQVGENNYNGLWGLSIASYSLPKLVQQSWDQLCMALDCVLSLREECIVSQYEELYVSVGLWLEGSELSNIRRRFAAKAILRDVRRFKFQEWSHESFSCSIILMQGQQQHWILWGNIAARLLAWCPGVIEIDFNTYDKSIVMRSLRRRDIYRFCESCESYNHSQFSRPLLRGQIHPRSVSLTDVNL
jgi:hypothetical protein